MSVLSNDHLTITTPGGVAASLPELLGFTPEESIVAVFLKSDKVVVCMRTDIPTSWDEVAEQLESIALRVHADSVIVSICCARGMGELPYRREVASTLKELAKTALVVTAAMLVDGATYWEYDDAAKPSVVALRAEEGKILELDTSGLAVHAFASSRDEVVGRYSFQEELQPSDLLTQEVSKFLSSDPKERASAAWDSLCALTVRNDERAGDTESEKLRVFLMLTVQDVHVRDYMMGRIAIEPNPIPFVEAVVATALRTPLQLRPKIAGMSAALLAAFNPSTVPASCLAELAGNDPLANLVHQSIGSAMAPSAIRELLAKSLPQVTALLEGAHE